MKSLKGYFYTCISQWVFLIRISSNVINMVPTFTLYKCTRDRLFLIRMKYVKLNILHEKPLTVRQIQVNILQQTSRIESREDSESIIFNFGWHCEQCQQCRALNSAGYSLQQRSTRLWGVNKVTENCTATSTEQNRIRYIWASFGEKYPDIEGALMIYTDTIAKEYSYSKPSQQSGRKRSRFIFPIQS